MDKKIIEYINQIKDIKIGELSDSYVIQKYALYALAILGLLILFKFCVSARIQRKKHRALNYIKRFQDSFNRTKDIYEALGITKAQYRKGSKEYKLLDNALYHLDHSISRDYLTALNPIEKYYNNPDINRIHQFAIFTMKTAALEEKAHIDKP